MFSHLLLVITGEFYCLKTGEDFNSNYESSLFVGLCGLLRRIYYGMINQNQS